MMLQSGELRRSGSTTAAQLQNSILPLVPSTETRVVAAADPQDARSTLLGKPQAPLRAWPASLQRLVRGVGRCSGTCVACVGAQRIGANRSRCDQIQCISLCACRSLWPCCRCPPGERSSCIAASLVLPSLRVATPLQLPGWSCHVAAAAADLLRQHQPYHCWPTDSPSCSCCCTGCWWAPCRRCACCL